MSHSHPTLVFVPLMLNLLFEKQIQGFDLNLCVSFNQLIRELEKKRVDFDLICFKEIAICKSALV